MKSSAIGRERSQFKRGKKKKKKSESNESSCVTISISFRGNVVEVENIEIETIFSIFSRAHCALDNTLKEGNGEKRRVIFRRIQRTFSRKCLDEMAGRNAMRWKRNDSRVIRWSVNNAGFLEILLSGACILRGLEKGGMRDRYVFPSQDFVRSKGTNSNVIALNFNESRPLLSRSLLSRPRDTRVFPFILIAPYLEKLR